MVVTLPFTVLFVLIVKQGGVAALLFGLLGICFFGFVTLAVARDMVRPHDLLRIGSNGIDQRATSPRSFIPWSEVADISIIKRGHGVKAIGITVRDPDHLPRALLPIRAIRSRWGGRVVKAALATTEVFYAGWTSAPDAFGHLFDDVAPHATLEIPATILTMRADDLAALLRERQATALGEKA